MWHRSTDVEPRRRAIRVNEYVVDASAAVSALGRKAAIGIAAHKRIAEETCHAPHLLDAEVGHILRRGERAGEISE